MTTGKRFAGKITLVTGATRGLGRAVALALAREGAHVVMIGRTVGALEEVDDEIRKLGASSTLVAMDLRNGEKLDALGPSMFQRWDRLDVLIANAGVLGPVSPLNHVTTEAWAEVIDINLTANWRLIRTLDPLLRRSAAGRALFVSSGAAQRIRAYWGPYAVSKAGLEALVKSYACEIANTNVRANIVNPGPMRTAMRAKAYPGEKPEAVPAPEAIAERLIELVLPEVTSNGKVFSLDARKR
jgi:NAD(P)-dependent dehydrogenase (short-subunit alcohol dehydrogenase family)